MLCWVLRSKHRKIEYHCYHSLQVNLLPYTVNTKPADALALQITFLGAALGAMVLEKSLSLSGPWTKLYDAVVDKVAILK